jgi:hypothetical protein
LLHGAGSLVAIHAKHTPICFLLATVLTRGHWRFPCLGFFLACGRGCEGGWFRDMAGGESARFAIRETPLPCPVWSSAAALRDDAVRGGGGVGETRLLTACFWVLGSPCLSICFPVFPYNIPLPLFTSPIALLCFSVSLLPRLSLGEGGLRGRISSWLGGWVSRIHGFVMIVHRLWCSELRGVGFRLTTIWLPFSNGIPKRLHAAMSQDAMKGPSANQRRCAHVHHRVYTLYSVQNQGDNSVTNSFCTKPGKYQDRQVGLGG